MRVLLAGDTHGNHRHVDYLLKMAAELQADRIVQVGDFGYWPHLSDYHRRVSSMAQRARTPIYWLDGNHENFDALEVAVDVDADEPQGMLPDLWYLPRGCTWAWDGCRFMSLGGAYSIDKSSRTEGYSWWPQETLTRAQVERAMDRGPVDVLLTHDTPEGVCPIVDSNYKGDDISRGNRKAVSAVADAVTPRLVVHGHYHHRYTAAYGAAVVEGLDRDDQGPTSWLCIDTADWATTETTASHGGTA